MSNSSAVQFINARYREFEKDGQKIKYFKCALMERQSDGRSWPLVINVVKDFREDCLKLTPGALYIPSYDRYGNLRYMEPVETQQEV